MKTQYKLKDLTLAKALECLGITAEKLNQLLQSDKNTFTALSGETIVLLDLPPSIEVNSHKYEKKIYINFPYELLEKTVSYEKDTWYPYPKHKPNTSGRYLVTSAHGYICLDYYSKEEDCWDITKSKEVVAFRLLPDAYLANK